MIYVFKREGQVIPVLDREKLILDGRLHPILDVLVLRPVDDAALVDRATDRFGRLRADRLE